MELTKERLEEMAAVDIRTVDISTLTDLRDIEIDTSLPVEKKLDAFARQTNNVYVNRIGDYVVKVRFQKDGASIDDKMAEYLQLILLVIYLKYLFYLLDNHVKHLVYLLDEYFLHI